MTTYAIFTAEHVDTGTEYETDGATAAASLWAAEQFTYAALEGDAAVTNLSIEADRHDNNATVTVTYDDGTECAVTVRHEHARYTDAQYFTLADLAALRRPTTECDPATCENRYHD